mmetsp:Transcript_23563/g.64111  ORF Transcript_23563/g.64111 Transcript_23563/m.64111 type:complete len:223 (-) Transcript_23563:392-1060(-)
MLNIPPRLLPLAPARASDELAAVSVTTELVPGLLCSEAPSSLALHAVSASEAPSLAAPAVEVAEEPPEADSPLGADAFSASVGGSTPASASPPSATPRSSTPGLLAEDLACTAAAVSADGEVEAASPPCGSLSEASASSPCRELTEPASSLEVFSAHPGEPPSPSPPGWPVKALSPEDVGLAGRTSRLDALVDSVGAGLVRETPPLQVTLMSAGKCFSSKSL